MRKKIDLVKPSAGKNESMFYSFLLLMAVLLAGFVKDTFFLDMLIQMTIWACAAFAWNIMAGYAGGLSLGHAIFFGIGAYASSILYTRAGISPWLGMWMGVLIAAIIAGILGVICFRLKGAFLTLATIAFAQLGLILAINWKSVTLGTEGILLPIHVNWSEFLLNKNEFAFVALFLLVVFYGISKYFERSRYGFFMMAYRENSDAARSLGVNIFFVKTMSFVISAGMMALVGSFYAQYIRYIDPNSTLATVVSIEIALIGMIGGLGKAEGPILGALLMEPVKHILRSWLGGSLIGVHMIIYGTLLVLIVLYLPNGLAPELKKLLSGIRINKIISKRLPKKEV